MGGKKFICVEIEIRNIHTTELWTTRKNKLIVSPSDIGILNMLKLKTYYFIDFEYVALTIQIKLY